VIFSKKVCSDACSLVRIIVHISSFVVQAQKPQMAQDPKQLKDFSAEVKAAVPVIVEETKEVKIPISKCSTLSVWFGTFNPSRVFQMLFSFAYSESYESYHMFHFPSRWH
jgi:hypothetical protein